MQNTSQLSLPSPCQFWQYWKSPWRGSLLLKMLSATLLIPITVLLQRLSTNFNSVLESKNTGSLFTVKHATCPISVHDEKLRVRDTFLFLFTPNATVHTQTGVHILPAIKKSRIIWQDCNRAMQKLRVSLAWRSEEDLDTTTFDFIVRSRNLNLPTSYIFRRYSAWH